MVLDKGTLDAVIFGGEEATWRYLCGVERAMKFNGGVFIQITEDSETYVHSVMCTVATYLVHSGTYPPHNFFVSFSISLSLFLLFLSPHTCTHAQL